MITKIICPLSRSLSIRCTFQPTRNFQVTVVGAATKIGSELASLLQKNCKITRLKLFDVDCKVLEVADKLATASYGARVCGLAGGAELDAALMASSLVLIVHNADSNAEIGSQQQVNDNAHLVRDVCTVLARCNPSAVLGISTDPVNVMVPYASRILSKHGSFDPKKVFGITNAGASIVKAVAAKELGVNKRFLSIPVIGGHSSETIVPLFSRLEPRFYSLSKESVFKLTNLVRDSFPATPQVGENASAAIALAIYQFTEHILSALEGKEEELNCYVKNANFGTEFFSGPTTIGPSGVVQLPKYFTMSQDERNLLINAVRCINRDIAYAEKLALETSTHIVEL